MTDCDSSSREAVDSTSSALEEVPYFSARQVPNLPTKILVFYVRERTGSFLSDDDTRTGREVARLWRAAHYDSILVIGDSPLVSSIHPRSATSVAAKWMVDVDVPVECLISPVIRHSGDEIDHLVAVAMNRLKGRMQNRGMGGVELTICGDWQDIRFLRRAFVQRGLTAKEQGVVHKTVSSWDRMTAQWKWLHLLLTD